MAGQQYINYGAFLGWANKIESRNTTLLEELQTIKNVINSLKGSYESNAAEEIRSNITNMEKNFKQYYDVVDNYAKFVRNTGEEWEELEKTQTSNAAQLKRG